MSKKNNAPTTFWDHLDELRSVFVRCFIALLVVASVCFFFKDTLFQLVLAPKNSDFITYRIMDHLLQSVSSTSVDSFSISLINTELAQQFIVHMKMAFYMAFLLVFPYLLYEVFRFVKPALYEIERKYTVRVLASGYFMFMIGVCISYFLIFPLTFRFLGTYQVSSEVINTITLNSYIGTMMTLNLTMGILFEIPILCWMLAKLGIIDVHFLKRYRKHAIVGILVIAAIITPTADAVTMLFVALPIYLLYEFSIVIVHYTEQHKEVVATTQSA